MSVMPNRLGPPDRYYRALCRHCGRGCITTYAPDMAGWVPESAWRPGEMILAICPDCCRALDQEELDT
jgi:hypothetical protein